MAAIASAIGRTNISAGVIGVRQKARSALNFEVDSLRVISLLLARGSERGRVGGLVRAAAHHDKSEQGAKHNHGRKGPPSDSRPSFPFLHDFLSFFSK